MNNKLIFLLAIAFVSCSPKIQKARIVLLPDTQTYAEKYPEIMMSQIDWVLANKKSINFVLQQGDLTNNNNDEQWQVVRSSFKKLNNKVPYVLAIGNHDIGDGGRANNRDAHLFNKYFPLTEMRQLSGFSETKNAGKLENAYYLFETGKIKWLVLSLEFGPRDETLTWADKIAKKYKDRIAILNTHAYMYSDSTRLGPGDKWRPQVYGVGKDSVNGSVNDGEQIWDKLVKINPNIRFVFSGHILNGGVGTLVSMNDKGKNVYQMLANFQSGVAGSVKGGNGYLRIVDMDFKNKKLFVSTYSPYINDFKRENAHEFSFENVEFSAQ
ncbi:MAG: metallophosphatase [Sphingobacteriales bacterium 41-5]|nr:MAG: metallophosphatase [Sphingobacteriales bacterium 41-5]